ncbi:MAG TPA: glycoside hydrolase family 15 protein [Aggregatilinea sp.]|uniref:glycoside hydrolase family 15 protein n=1 Tax=Aggregatilinea sp. TaxID=2806333 RepID=UPI002CCC48D1|nr:glycoside hydrolase family 15 protein [Aggregatilinea sp.]HML21435.1 glycoside hydrolase family 15 protein [Aggregatilinea sp.]
MNLIQSSIEIIRAGQAPSGAYVASPTFSQYGYAWLRDGAWVAYGMDCAGLHDSSRAFYVWAGRTLVKHEDRLNALLDKLAQGETPDETDYLPTRFTLDGDLGMDFWWDFQLDGYGTWLWGLAEHVKLTGDTALWDASVPAIRLTVRYLAALWSSPNYDCWEEARDQIHTSTLAAIYGGLIAVRAVDSALVPDGLLEQIRTYTLEHCLAPEGYLQKTHENPAVDASLLWTAVPYGLVDARDPIFARTLAKIERDLLVPGGGVYRYAADTYYGGGEWILLTAWLAWMYVELGRIDEARGLMRWIEAQANEAGELPEQVADHMRDASYYPEWEAKWGSPASPLLWSHAMVLVVHSLLDKHT